MSGAAIRLPATGDRRPVAVPEARERSPRRGKGGS